MIVEKIKTYIYRLFVKHFMPKHNLLPDQYIEDMAGTRYRIEACYYTTDLKPIVIASDVDGNLRSFPENHIEAIDG